MKIPTIEQALIILVEAEKLNQGAWADHSKHAATSAKSIAAHCHNLDEDAAYVFGLLHDIGRREGRKELAHTTDGYKYLMNMGYEDAAAICLTHSFSVRDINAYAGNNDWANEDVKLINRFLDNHPYSDYDKLIQLCDAIAMPHGGVLIEKRLSDVAMRYGVNQYTISKWRAIFELKSHFDMLTGCNIYTLIPDISDNTFEW